MAYLEYNKKIVKECSENVFFYNLFYIKRISKG